MIFNNTTEEAGGSEMVGSDTPGASSNTAHNSLLYANAVPARAAFVLECIQISGVSRLV